MEHHTHHDRDCDCGYKLEFGRGLERGYERGYAQEPENKPRVEAGVEAENLRGSGCQKQEGAWGNTIDTEAVVQREERQEQSARGSEPDEVVLQAVVLQGLSVRGLDLDAVFVLFPSPVSQVQMLLWLVIAVYHEPECEPAPVPAPEGEAEPQEDNLS